MRDALFPALVAIGYCNVPDTAEPNWLSVRSAKDAAQIIVDSGAVDVDFESADIVLRDAIELATDLVTGDFGRHACGGRFTWRRSRCASARSLSV